MNILPINHIELSELEMQKQLINVLKDRRFFKDGYNWTGINAKVYSEIHIPEISRRSDIIMVLPSQIINIECKLLNYTEVLQQARDHALWADYSYICIHHSAYVPNYIIHLMIKNKIGLIYWLKEMEFVEVVQAMKNRANKDIKERVIKTLGKYDHKTNGVEENKQAKLIFNETSL